MKRTLSLVLCLTMALMLLTLAVPALAAKEVTVAKIGNKGYTTLFDAVTAVRNGGTIKLVRNCEFIHNNLNSPVFFSGKKFTIDMNRKTMTLMTGWGGTFDNCNITFKNGTIKSEAGYGETIKFRKKSNVKFNNVNVKQICIDVSDAKTKATMTKVNYSGGFFYIVSDGGTLQINSGTYSSKGILFVSSNGNIIINGGSFSGQSDSYNMFQLNRGDKVTINKGAFNAGTTILQLYDSGSVTIKGGTLSSKNDSVIEVYRSTLKIAGGTVNGGTDDDAAVEVHSGKLVLKGGTVINHNGDALSYSSDVTVVGNGTELISKEEEPEEPTEYSEYDEED